MLTIILGLFGFITIGVVIAIIMGFIAISPALLLIWLLPLVDIMVICMIVKMIKKAFRRKK